MAKYLNDPANERIIHGEKGHAGPGEAVDLTDREFAAFTEAGYKLTPVDAKKPAK